MEAIPVPSERGYEWVNVDRVQYINMCIETHKNSKYCNMKISSEYVK